MSLLNYMNTEWSAGITDELNGLSRNFPGINGFYAPDSGWFYEGTVQAIAFAHLSRWAVANAAGQYALFSEQPYPRYPLLRVVDIMTSNRANQLLLVEIKADFNIGSVIADIDKLDSAVFQLGTNVIDATFAMYCVTAANVERWQYELTQYAAGHSNNPTQPLPIIKY